MTITPYFPHTNKSINYTVKLKKLSDYPGQNNKRTINGTGIKSHFINNQTLNIAGQMDDNICLVEFLGYNKEPLNIVSFVSRGNVQCLAEIIIGNGLAAGSRYITVLRHRKSGRAEPKSHDRQLMRHLLSGLYVLETKLLDYIIFGGGTIFSANEAGILENKDQRSHCNRIS
jgi:hypothetical protein